MAVRLASSPALINFSHGFRVFSLDHGHPDSILGRPGAPGIDFGSRNAPVFALCCHSCRRDFNFVRSVQNIGRSYTFGTSELLRDKTKTTKTRSASMLDSVQCCNRAPMPVWVARGASQDQPRLAFGRSWGAFASPGASQERSWGDVWPSRRRPGHVPARPRNGFGRPERPESEFP